MLFNSLEFLIFFPVVTALYFAVGLRARWAVLVVASSLFYMVFIPEYIAIIYATIAVDYCAGLVIERSSGRRRTAWLILSLAANIGALAVFKYFNFFIDNANAITTALGISTGFSHWEIVLPIGLSFHTFQAMSYTIEVYRGTQRAERNLAVYALYVLFYPQLVAGPVERPQNILHQLHKIHAFDTQGAVHGLQIMLWGFFKKIVVADQLARVVDVVYANPSDWSGPVLIVATVAFAVQIYADFSGYSDIAIGAAQVMGIRLMTNFRQPYLSRSVSEFWTRWHISLSSWFRDYVYVPLGGNRVGPLRHRFNLIFTFALSGLWHGANWTFAAWGCLNGAYLIAERELGLEKGRSWLRLAPTFLLITLSWVFFRARNVSEAVLVLRGMTRGLNDLARPLTLSRDFVAHSHLDAIGLATGVAGAGAVLAVDAWLSRKKLDVGEFLRQLPPVPRWASYYFAGFAITGLGYFGAQQFIYFQF